MELRLDATRRRSMTRSVSGMAASSRLRRARQAYFHGLQVHSILRKSESVRATFGLIKNRHAHTNDGTTPGALRHGSANAPKKPAQIFDEPRAQFETGLTAKKPINADQRHFSQTQPQVLRLDGHLKSERPANRPALQPETFKSRSEERRVGKECRYRRARYQCKKRI